MWVPIYRCKLFPWLITATDVNAYERLRKFIGVSKVVEPCYAREVNGVFEIIDGRARVSIAQGLGIGIIPVIVKQFTDDDAKLFIIDKIVEEQKLSQLKRTDLAEVVTTYTKIVRMRNFHSLTKLQYKGDSEGRLDTVKWCSNKLGISSRTVSRYLRVSHLIDEWKEVLDYGSIALRVAVEISYLSKQEQKRLWEVVYPAVSITGKDIRLFKEYKLSI